MSDWSDLNAELDLWADAGRVARLWWRDDDAVAASPALDRLLSCRDGVPLSLAVIPDRLEHSLVDRLDGEADLLVLPHGFAHRNHEPPDRKKAEFGGERNEEEALRDIAEGCAGLAKAFGPVFFGLFVPPWNRIAPGIAARLTDLGLVGVSTYTDRAPEERAFRLNTHVDPLDWKEKKRSGAARFLGEEAALSLLTDALRRRREGVPGTDQDEAVGILTHHLEHDPGTWDFLVTLVQAVRAHPASEWVSARQAMAAGLWA
ncbi:hypothetical protein HH303_11820 [Rhodospirillaceae bacterium KN72]|uniref:Polysaccharide deacetylase n=1 Tax=Pacificispira spongiicola TaxID=2729598 RepID=A0A7Y0HES2_9PROT|nr:polysaccharide deacetylase family protein [Pacificispira spongiicola]NMM45171.1 hypothetical protein [Pacificispira spongiicola]